MEPERVVDSQMYLSGSKVRRIITRELGSKLSRGVSIHIADGEYYMPHISYVRKIVAKSRVDRLKWISNRHDCDDFAHLLKADFIKAGYRDGRRRAACCVGVVWGLLPGPHAINFFIDDKQELYFIEPQTDEIYSPRDNDRSIWYVQL
jgi:hypothetical protein